MIKGQCVTLLIIYYIGSLLVPPPFAGLEINGCLGARGTEILGRASRFLRLGARQAPTKNGKVRTQIYTRAPEFLARHRDFLTSVPGRHRPKTG